MVLKLKVENLCRASKATKTVRTSRAKIRIQSLPLVPAQTNYCDLKTILLFGDELTSVISWNNESIILSWGRTDLCHLMEQQQWNSDGGNTVSDSRVQRVTQTHYNRIPGADGC